MGLNAQGTLDSGVMLWQRCFKACIWECCKLLLWVSACGVCATVPLLKFKNLLVERPTTPVACCSYLRWAIPDYSRWASPETWMWSAVTLWPKVSYEG